MTNPKINVTPLIDVLLVLLIIFMVISPARPSKFESKIPQEPKHLRFVEPNPQTLVVSLQIDSQLKLNNQADMGSVSDPSKLTEKLVDTFRARQENAERDAVVDDAIERTVFIKAGTRTNYGEVVKVVDAVKASGAFPISLMIDDLDR